MLPAGDLAVWLERVDGETLMWSWAPADQPIFPRPLATLPDDEPSTVRLTSGPNGFMVRHEAVLGRHAVALGLIWDHLLDAAGSYPWMPTLREQAAEATALVERPVAWRPNARPSSGEVLRRQIVSAGLSAKRGPWPGSTARSSTASRALPTTRQREAACWAARRAMRVAGLEQIGWIADALTAAYANRPTAPSLHRSARRRRIQPAPVR